jgi:hypothetical protein
MPVVTFPSSANNPVAAGVLALARVYIGGVDLDPTVLANRISVTIIQQDGTPVVIAPSAQPFILNAGGMFTYGGSPVILTASESYSMAVHTSADVPVYYLPDSATLSADVSTDLVSLVERSGEPSPTANTGKLFTLAVAGITELFYMDSEGNFLQLTNAGNINVDLSNSEITAAIISAVEEVTGLQFRGEPVELVIDVNGNVEMDVTLGSSYSLTMDQNVNTLSFTNAPDGRVPDMGLSIINEGAYTITTIQVNTPGAEVWIPNAVTSLQPTASATTSYGIKLFAGAIFHIFPVRMQQII